MSFEFKPQNANNTGYPATAYGAGDKSKFGGDSGTGSGQTKSVSYTHLTLPTNREV